MCLNCCRGYCNKIIGFQCVCFDNNCLLLLSHHDYSTETWCIGKQLVGQSSTWLWECTALAVRMPSHISWTTCGPISLRYLLIWCSLSMMQWRASGCPWVLVGYFSTHSRWDTEICIPMQAAVVREKDICTTVSSHLPAVVTTHTHAHTYAHRACSTLLGKWDRPIGRFTTLCTLALRSVSCT